MTKGDANEDPDPQPVPASNVVGTAVLTIPLIGYVIHFANTPLGFAAFVLLPLGLLAVTEAWSIARRSGSSGGAASGGSPERDEPTSERAGSIHGSATGDGAHARTPVDDGEGPAAEPGATTGGPMADGTGATGRAIGPTDLAVTLLVLVLLTPYTAYVALRLQTLMAFAVAYAVGFSALALGVLEGTLFYRSVRTGDRSRTEKNGEREEEGEEGEELIQRESDPLTGVAEAPDPEAGQADEPPAHLGEPSLQEHGFPGEGPTADVSDAAPPAGREEIDD
ncbi:hypothetical protein [Salinarchaeum sp. Harcht-Bsk1]|uniref:hypothetical protein n=1 Tax=Salinarchaeum sp. Harcht-Bsk1 TaxID=1333523 RepID=UPI000677B733|nr:hypothetical protein [Salinarchaeum sp. Harcht-Bsk1]